MKTPCQSQNSQGDAFPSPPRSISAAGRSCLFIERYDMLLVQLKSPGRLGTLLENPPAPGDLAQPQAPVWAHREEAQSLVATRGSMVGLLVCAEERMVQMSWIQPLLGASPWVPACVLSRELPGGLRLHRLVVGLL